MNFMSHSGRSIHFIEDQDVPPMAYAEQFADPDPSKALPPEELLRQARLILSTQLGADPLLRRHVRDLYKNFAQVSVSPTERGKSKIDEYHTYYVSISHNGRCRPFANIGYRALNICRTSPSRRCSTKLSSCIF